MLKNKFHQAKSKKNALFFLAFCITCMIVAISIPVFAKEEPVKSITIESENLSYEENKPGSYKITKQAEWIGKGKARITFQVDTKELLKENINTDTILIIDTSGSMTGDKLDKVKSDSIDLINKLLENTSNRVSMIEFNTNATTISDFTNNASELNDKINNLQATGGTSYYQALVKLDELLKTYQKEENKEVTVLFFIGSLPNMNTPNEVGQYKYLKSEYPYLNINGIQYEMGDKVLDEIESISDNQFIADMNTLNNVLIDALSLSEMYNDFEVTDYINTEHFNIEDKNAITTSTGKFTLDKANGKITWNLDGLSSGTSATMTIDIYLKNEYINNPNLYKTNTKEEVTSEIKGIKEDISKTDTPILSNGFTVIYDENAPEGCSVEGAIPDTKDYSTFNPVKIENVTLTCGGYEFQGWEVVNKENVSMIGNNHFVSDGNDIKLRAIWSKVSLKKSMDGTVHEVKPVIKVAQYYQGDFWSDTYKLNTTKIVIQNELNPIEEAVEFWDVSEANDGSVMAYAVLNEDGNTYTIYIQGDGKVIANEDSSYLFYRFEDLESIEGLEYLDTSNVTSMIAMFGYCRSLTTLDLSNFDTSNVTDMNHMFYNCESLTSIDISNFNTSKVTDMNNMFYWCENLIELDVGNFNTSKVTDMSFMFYRCRSLTTIDVSNFDTSNVTNMMTMFSTCSSLTAIDVSNFDTSNVTVMMSMFSNCSSLTAIDVSNFDTSKVTHINAMFSNCSSLTTIDFRNADFSSVTSYTKMFGSTSNLSVIVKDESARSWIQDKLGSNGTAIIAS